MRSKIAVLSVLLALAGASRLSAQEWSPPSREMPTMPTAAQLQGDWRAATGAWFGGVEALSGVPLASVRATGESMRGGGPTRMVRFTGGTRPVALWSDRNGDGKADLIEVYRGGNVAAQLIDADYDGTANVLRLYDASGALTAERRL